ncbi:hypothetical protein [Streptomyces sp. NPDC096339]|uniref:hypothetical protein n=1 Tax=Streptomyces sp. NPDC096339 TaxID=3366086 RepID=UPI0038037BED
MNKPLTALSAAAALLLVGAGWYVAAEPASTTLAVCGADLSKDPVVADRFPAMAVVETLENTRARDDEGGSSYLSSRVRVLRTLHGTLPELLTLTQGVTKGGTAAGRYVDDDPFYAVLEPGRAYVVGISTMDDDGRGPWAGYVVPARRGVDGEAAHWREARRAVAPPPPPCDDVVIG